MIPIERHRDRRAALTAQVSGPILLFANGTRSRNLPMNELPFRQDSSFLYFTGCPIPGAVALLESDRCEIFVPPTPPDDALWHGPSPSLAVWRETLGVDAVHELGALEGAIHGRACKTTAVADPAINAVASELTGIPLHFASEHGHLDLVDAIIRLRQQKDEAELNELRQAAKASAAAFRTVMSATHPGGSERALHALFEASLAIQGCVPGYHPILTVRGEILHNHSHGNDLNAGDLLLLDGGGERPSGYTVDITRTWPVSGKFSPKQRAVYDVVLESQRRAIEACTLNTPYRKVHDLASEILGQWLIDEGFITCSLDEAMTSGAVGVFYPHGTGHHLGLDVHDLENYGDRPSYAPGAGRPSAFGTRNLRLDLPLQEDWVVTIEPGLYWVPAILENQALHKEIGRRVDWEKAASWSSFGGIRIEDDIRITSGTPEVLTASTPKTIPELEQLIGSGPTPEQRLL